jgi:hypothetical protein
VEPLAKSASTEASKYFPNARVYGYHGIGITNGIDYIHKARCLDSEFDPTTRRISSWKRAKDARRLFTK